jgi:hypothetical protein
MEPDTGAKSSSTPSPPTSHSSTSYQQEGDEVRQRKRERDRKSQQAMRDRSKWTIHNLMDQVAFLTRSMEEMVANSRLLNTRLAALEVENEQLRVQNAALRLSVIGADPEQSQLVLTTLHPPFVTPPSPCWQFPPQNSPPGCLADQILLEFVDSRRHASGLNGADAAESAPAYPLKPNLYALLNNDRKTSDETSNIVGDVVRSYAEIETLPKQVAVHYVMWTLLKVWSEHQMQCKLEVILALTKL